MSAAGHGGHGQMGGRVDQRVAGEMDTRIKEGRLMGRWIESGGNDEMEREGGAWMDGR